MPGMDNSLHRDRAFIRLASLSRDADVEPMDIALGALDQLNADRVRAMHSGFFAEARALLGQLRWARVGSDSWIFACGRGNAFTAAA